MWYTGGRRGERTSHPKGGDSTIQRGEGEIDGGTARVKGERQKTWLGATGHPKVNYILVIRQIDERGSIIRWYQETVQKRKVHSSSRDLASRSFWSLVPDPIQHLSYHLGDLQDPQAFPRCSRVISLSVMKMKIHDVPMKDECCYLVAMVLLTCLLDNTNMVLLTCLNYGTGTIQIRSVIGDPPVTL